MVTATSATATFAGRNGVLAFPYARSLWTIRPDGTGLRRIATEREFSSTSAFGIRRPEWSPSGKRLVFSAPSNGRCATPFYETHPDGSHRHQVIGTDHPGESCRGDFEAVYQPGHNQLVFSRGSFPRGVRMFTTSLDSLVGGPFRIPDRYHGPSDPGFSTDGRTFVFSAAIGSRRQIFAAVVSPSGDVESQTIKALTLPTHESYAASLSPDGSTVVFSARIGAGTAIFSVSVSGADPRRLTPVEPTQDIVAPVFSPDGRYVAYEHERPYNSQIWIMDADGRHPHQLTHFRHQARVLTTVDMLDPAWQSIR
jgi:Tol biopolymer transport system component